MAERFGMVAVAYLLLWSSEIRARGQEAEELLQLPPLKETTQEEMLREDETTWRWIPPVVTKATTPVANFFAGGHFVSDWQIGVLNSSPNPNDDAIVTSQLQFGWEWATGTGARIEWFDFDNEWQLQSPEGFVGTPVSGNIGSYLPYYAGSALVGRDLDTVHWDIYRRYQWGVTQILIGGGLSNINFRDKYKLVFDTGPPGGQFEFDVSREFFTGLGAGLVAETRRPLLTRDSSGVNFLCNGRSFVIPGEMEVRSAILTATYNDTLWVNKGGAGLEYYKRFRRCTFKLRGLAEAQYWDSDVLAVDSLVGGSVSVDFWY